MESKWNSNEKKGVSLCMVRRIVQKLKKKLLKVKIITITIVINLLRAWPLQCSTLQLNMCRLSQRNKMKNTRVNQGFC